MKVSLPYIHEYRDRHGKVRRYFRRPGQPRIALPGEPQSSEFIEVYQAARGGFQVALPAPARPGAGSVSAAIAAYYQDAAFLSLAVGTRKSRRQILERFRAADGDKPINLMRREHIAKRLGKLKPFAARNWLKAIRGLMQFAVATGLCSADPTADFKPAKVRAGTIHTWTEDEIAAYEHAFAIGSRPRLAMALLLFTAARCSDAVRLGPQHVRAGRIVYRQQKTGRHLEIPIHPKLAEILSATPSGHLTFLATTYGTPYTPKGLGNAMRRWCDQAGLPQCSAHGLRKAQARRLAEAGCSAHEIAAITGHKTLSEVQRYADAADQARLAEAAISRTELANQSERLANLGNNLLKLQESK